jgi:hypothetical protein
VDPTGQKESELGIRRDRVTVAHALGRDGCTLGSHISSGARAGTEGAALPGGEAACILRNTLPVYASC